jgi:aminoglycoside phosphotransferase (APT) family kinase protein
LTIQPAAPRFPERVSRAAFNVDDRLFVDLETVRRLLEDQFPQWAHLPVVAITPGGWSNRTFRLGDQMTVRLPSATRYAQEAKKEQEVLPRLAPSLPVLIPNPIALGGPGAGYPFHWSIMRWIEGKTPARADFSGPEMFARDLGDILRALHRIDATAGPEAGEHSFHRGGSLAVYDAEVKLCLKDLADEIDAGAAGAVWATALASSWRSTPVCVHGDLAPGNLLMEAGRLRAVIDFGNCAVGDPACDLFIAWTFFEGAARTAFRECLHSDQGTWQRARGWAIWKAMLIMSGRSKPQALERAPMDVFETVLTEHFS